METQDFARHAPGLIGSVVALLWVRDTWKRSVACVGGGMASSYYVSPSVVVWTSADPSLAGFLVGLFSVAVAAKLFETIDAVQPRSVIDRILRKIGI